MINKGDKFTMINKVGFVDRVGEIFVVNYASEMIVDFIYNKNCHFVIPTNMVNEYFKKYEEPKKNINTVTNEMIEEIMNHSKVIVSTVFDKCTVVSCKLPNGFVIVESSACVDPKNYDEDMGVEICMKKIINKVWELEGYRLQQKLYEDANGCTCDGDCDTCDEDVFPERCPYHCTDDCESCGKKHK